MRITQRILVTATITLAITASAVPPSSADHASPVNGSRHLYGEMVDYPLVFPVVGEYWYGDWFWALRAGGFHHGHDVFADKMTPVVAVASGTVLRVNGSTSPAHLNPERCCSVVILHDDGWQSFYVHLNNDTPGTDDGLGWGVAPGIVPGTRVDAGDHIGWVGDSGNAETTPPHLHFELRDPDGIPVNSFTSLRAAEGMASCRSTRLGDMTGLVDGQGLLRRGSHGTAVRLLQQALSRLGHAPGMVDGVFGPLTERAVIAFQRARGIDVDGLVGSQSRAEISTLWRLSDAASLLGVGGRVLDVGARGWDVRELQTLLAAVGHDPGPADGVFGSRTATAVRSFQASAGLPVDGLVGGQTRRSLMERVGISALVSCG
jgi:peptidoglycan hydrolase-like protein with peptidoglycan-binding domain